MHAFPKSLHFNQDRQDSSWIFLRITKSTHFHIYFRLDWNAVIWEMCACSAMCNSLWPHEVIVHHAPLFMQFSRQEYWNGSLFPPPGYFPNQGIKPTTLMSPAPAGGFYFTTGPLVIWGSEVIILRNPILSMSIKYLLIYSTHLYIL